MKKFALSLLCSAGLSLAAQAQVLISEIMYNPPEAGTDSLEFIELYNNSASDVSLENWSFTGVTFIFPAVTIPSQGFLVTCVNAGALQNQLGVSGLQWTGGGLNNNGEPIKLLDAGGNTIDEVTYSNMAPWPVGAAGNGPSIVLCDLTSDNSLPQNWQIASTATGVMINGKELFCNPGAPPNCQSIVIAVADQFVAASGEPATFNVLANDVLPGGGTSAVVTIAAQPANGSATANPDKTVTYTSTAGYAGSDVFTYQVCENGDCKQANVTVTVRKYPKYTIDQINNVNMEGLPDSAGIFCELTGVVYGVNLRPQALQFTIIDDTNNGITVFSAVQKFGYTVTEKDKVTVRGTLFNFSGLLQILPDNVIKVSAGNPLVTPQVVTTHTEDTESKLIKINNLRYVDAAQWTTGMGIGGFNVFMVSDDHPLDTILVRIDNDVNLYNEPAPPAPFNLTGIGGQFDLVQPFTSGYQIAPRYTQDVSTLVASKEADFSAYVRLSPNPASDYLLLQTTTDFDVVRFFSSDGRAVSEISSPVREERFDVSAWAPGLYVARFEKDGVRWATKFVKQ